MMMTKMAMIRIVTTAGVGSCEPSLGRVRNTPDTRDAFLPVSLYYYRDDDDDDFYEDDNDDDDDGKKEGSPASFIGFGLISPNWAKPTELLLPNVDDDDFDYYDDDDDDDDDCDTDNDDRCDDMIMNMNMTIEHIFKDH